MKNPSPSLRGSGLKCQIDTLTWLTHSVSLFTREWIEIETKSKRLHREAVSLFTREWIEIISVNLAE